MNCHFNMYIMLTAYISLFRMNSLWLDLKCICQEGAVNIAENYFSQFINL